jgi:hypothetical protein
MAWLAGFSYFTVVPVAGQRGKEPPILSQNTRLVRLRRPADPKPCPLCAVYEQVINRARKQRNNLIAISQKSQHSVYQHIPIETRIRRQFVAISGVTDRVTCSHPQTPLAPIARFCACPAVRASNMLRDSAPGWRSCQQLPQGGGCSCLRRVRNYCPPTLRDFSARTAPDGFQRRKAG